MLTQKDKSNIISYHIGEDRFPRNYRRDYFINDSWVNGRNQAVREWGENDVLSVEVFTPSGRCVTNKEIKRELTDSIVHWVSAKDSVTWRTPRDFQRSKVYSFERYCMSFVPVPLRYKLNKDEIEDIYRYIYASLGIDLAAVPKIEVSNAKKSYSTYYSFYNLIKLAAGWGQEIKVVLHELAHAIEDVLEDKADSVAHGRTFVAIIMALYELFIPEWNRGRAFAELKYRKIKWSETDYNNIKAALLGELELKINDKYYIGRVAAMNQYHGSR